MSVFNRNDKSPGIFDRLNPRGEAPEPGPRDITQPAPIAGLAELKYRVHEQLIREINLARLDGEAGALQRSQLDETIGNMLDEDGTPLSRPERTRLIGEIAAEVVGLGPIEPLIQDPTITEVMVNGYNKVYFERGGKLHLSDIKFRDDAHVMRIIDRIIGPLGRRLDESQPMVDARLPDGSRVNAIIPPIAIDGPSVTIRKFALDPFTVKDLIQMKTLSEEMAEFLRICVRGRLNMIITGGTGTGKTTLLNVLSSFIAHDERVVTIEDPCELQLRQPNVVRLETRGASIEGKGEITQRTLVRNALRMRPDRIIIGEVRSGEAFDMLQAMNTGHEGSLTTVHANSPRDGLARIENMVLMANLDLPLRAIREQVASAMHLAVHLNRMPDGTRRVTRVSEIVGMEGDVVTMQDLFIFRQSGFAQDGAVLGRIVPTGLRPIFAETLEQRGFPLRPDLFTLLGEVAR